MRTKAGVRSCRRAAIYVSMWASLLAIPQAWTQTPAAVRALDVDKLPVVKELPDPFLGNNGKRVITRGDWIKRREEIKEILLSYQYGHLAPSPDAIKASEASIRKIEGLDAEERQLMLFTGPDQKLSLRLILTAPTGKGPFPVVLKGDLCWGRVPMPILKSAVIRGYIVAEFDRTEIAPDSADRTKGVYPLYPDYDWAALAAWAWGYHRAVDYLVGQDFVDRNRITVTGHSRGGKAVLLAGALDERIALTAPNNSGCGGAGCYRIQGEKSEDIGAIARRFPFWFHPRLATFVERVDQLPLDQHFLRALVAPRALLTTEALGDLWANPSGTQVSYLAAREVFKFLGAVDKQGIYFREGKHEQNADDWNVLLDFADLQLFGRTVGTKFDRLVFPAVPGAFAWKSPAP